MFHRKAVPESWHGGSLILVRQRLPRRSSPGFTVPLQAETEHHGRQHCLRVLGRVDAHL